MRRKTQRIRIAEVLRRPYQVYLCSTISRADDEVFKANAHMTRYVARAVPLETHTQDIPHLAHIVMLETGVGRAKYQTRTTSVSLTSQPLRLRPRPCGTRLTRVVVDLRLALESAWFS